MGRSVGAGMPRTGVQGGCTQGGVAWSREPGPSTGSLGLVMSVMLPRHARPGPPWHPRHARPGPPWHPRHGLQAPSVSPSWPPGSLSQSVMASIR